MNDDQQALKILRNIAEGDTFRPLFVNASEDAHKVEAELRRLQGEVKRLKRKNKKLKRKLKEMEPYMVFVPQPAIVPPYEVTFASTKGNEDE